ncbi:hypothetical protein ES288_D05G218100v1 [Gossypium darwinii]|uniref:Uncharacterized protein n=1 Tax=Gossypium darwinii TaxID=34276 RepID=A0A5D2CKD9_GOSDA|nr:hypothetical protein ES288_D05G218100v1 [Gossypium darwinii]
MVLLRILFNNFSCFMVSLKLCRMLRSSFTDKRHGFIGFERVINILNFFIRLWLLKGASLPSVLLLKMMRIDYKVIIILSIRFLSSIRDFLGLLIARLSVGLIRFLENCFLVLCQLLLKLTWPVLSLMLKLRLPFLSNEMINLLALMGTLPIFLKLLGALLVLIFLQQLSSIYQLLPAFNATTITFVPICEHPKHVKEFRPIACYTTVYKCLSKVLVNRITLYLLGLILKSQSAFIKGRNINDNILLAYELMRGYNRKQISP